MARVNASHPNETTRPERRAPSLVGRAEQFNERVWIEDRCLEVIVLVT